MSVVNVLVNAVNGGSPDHLREAAANSEEESSEAASGTTMSTVMQDDEVLFPKEQVLTLLDAYDGRMWQQDVIAETGYSAGKVSCLLSEMEEDGQITRYWKSGAKVVADPELLPAALAET